MFMYGKEFDSHESMIEYLNENKHIHKADFKNRDGKYYLTIVDFDNPEKMLENDILFTEEELDVIQEVLFYTAVHRTLTKEEKDLYFKITNG